MTEEEARARATADVPRETVDRLDRYVTLLVSAARDQNLIAASTLPTLWQRHILDSAQLIPLAPSEADPWLDVGSGAGLPGLVVAILRPRAMILIEPRARRAAFLSEAVAALGLERQVTVIAGRAETAPPAAAAVISARAVAGLDALLAMGVRHARPDTRWLLPKGRSAAMEVAAARATWQGEFQLVPSVTDSQAAIIVATNVRPGKRR